MHTKPVYELLPYDSKIERTLRSLRKTRLIEESNMFENQTHRNEEGNQQQRTLDEIWKPPINENYSGVRMQFMLIILS